MNSSVPPRILPRALTPHRPPIPLPHPVEPDAAAKFFQRSALAILSITLAAACGSSESPAADPCATVTCAVDQQCVIADGRGVCEDACDPATEDCGGGGDCNTVCNTCDGQNRTCEPVTDCTSATCGDCIAGFEERFGSCVATDGFDCETCTAQNRECDTANEVCGACVAGFFVDGSTCREAGTCEPGAAGSIAADCEAQNRACVEATGVSAAECGSCIDGFVEIAGQAVCRQPSACQSDNSCADPAQFCVQLEANDTPQCVDRPCGEGEAWDRGNARCRTCAPCPSGNGTTGVLWPVTDRGGACLCETTEGFFWDPAVSGSRAVECDMDGDGWTNGKVAQLLSEVSSENGASFDDFSLLLNLRCAVKEISGFVLENEYGQRLDISLGELGSTAATVRLYESNRNDRGDAAAPLPTLGRAFRPEEVNSLTKVCGVNVDLNDNGLADVEESQEFAGGEEFQQIFNRLSHFSELYRGAIEDDLYVITERSRCDIGELGLRGPSTSTDYWQTCQRRRPEDYVSSQPLGADFARFDCNATRGSCPLPPLWGPTPAGGTIPERGVCALRGTSIPEWRGMTHYSQFSCVTVKSDNAVRAPQEIDRDAVSLDRAAGFHLNLCELGESADTFECTQVTTASAADAAIDRVVWAARGFEPYENVSEYAGGCVNEFTEWPETCPGQSTTPEFVVGRGSAEDFGRLICSFNQPPSADAGARFAAAISTQVTLDGTGSVDLDGDPLTFTWTQTLGPDVTGGAGTLTGTQPRFTAPSGVETLRFRLVVNDGEESSPPSSVIVDILEDPSAAVYVDRDRGSNQAGDGTQARPFASIGGAIGALTSAQEDIYVMTSTIGTYDETAASLFVPSGTSVYGGYNADWIRDYRNNRTSIETDFRGIRFLSIDTNATLSGFEIQTADGVDATSNPTGVMVTGNSSVDFVLEHNEITAGDVGLGVAQGASSYGALFRQLRTVRVANNELTAGNGGNGRDGEEGAQGRRGDNGSSTDSNSRGSGGSGGPGGDGGNGGSGGTRSLQNGSSGSGGNTKTQPDGSLARGGDGGSGGTNDGSNGSNGANGIRGRPGDRGNGVGAFDTVFQSGTGRRAERGGHGAGGGGGGGGEADFVARNGGGGGGGGEGGEGGQGGAGGIGGGASVGLYLFDVTTADVENNTIVAGNGGIGGSGGEGGDGGSGGSGGSGDRSVNGSAGRGGNGGRGGSAGRGGTGGAGGGGPSYGIAFSAGMQPTLTRNTVTSGTGGDGGAGGSRGNGGEGGYSFAIFDGDPNDAFNATLTANVLTAGVAGSGGGTGGLSGATVGPPGQIGVINTP